MVGNGTGDTLTVDDDSLRFEYDGDEPLDVMVEGRRIWSISPREDPVDETGQHVVDWPAALRRFLNGRATVGLVEHGSGRVVAEVDAVLGDGRGRVEIADNQGRPFSLTKYGRLNRPFDSVDESTRQGYLDQVDDVLRVLRDECGVPAFICYGSLLGAVRSGTLIGHDVDVDLGYFSSYEYPVDVMLETMRIERTLSSKGWRVVRETGGFIALFLPQADGTSRNLDIFTCFISGGYLYQTHDIRTPADRSAILPLKQIELEGRLFPAPAEPEVLFEAAYGPDWRIPDPAFTYHTPASIRSRLGPWLDGHRVQRDEWLRFFHSHDTPDEPTELGRVVVDRESPGQIVDLGCGVGRDSLLFAAHGFDVTAADFTGRMLRRGDRLAEGRQVTVSWKRCNLYSVGEALRLGLTVARTPGPRVVYTRALLHDLTPPAQLNFWRLVQMLTHDGGRLYLEFWTGSPPKSDAPATVPIRCPIDPDEVEGEGARRGARRIERLTGQTGIHRYVMEW